MSQQLPVRIATRKSPLALWQAHFVKDALQTLHPGLEVELVTMVTKGDIILDTPLAKVGGKGLFVKELEVAMLEGRADLAVHSMKDVPVEFPEGLGLVTICEREDPRDAFVSNTYNCIEDLPLGSVVGTWIGGKLTDVIGYYKVMLVSLFGTGILFVFLQYATTFHEFCFGIWR